MAQIVEINDVLHISSGSFLLKEPRTVTLPAVLTVA
jgi:hypothetical protein